MKKTAPFGSWDSSVTAAFVSGKDRGLVPDLQADGDDLYFLEARPDEGGRQALMRLGADKIAMEVLPKNCNVRTNYLEYGGSSFLVRNGEIFFIQCADQQIYRVRPGQEPAVLTHEGKSRFADLQFDAKRNRLIALRELEAKPEPKNTICAIDLASGAITDLVAGADFYLSPRLDTPCERLLWVSWNHPNMAWNGTELFVGDMNAAGALGEIRKIAGDPSHAVCLPEWTGADEITFVAELDNWLNLYRYSHGSTTKLYAREAEFAYPDWVPGQRRYAVLDGTLCAAFEEKGKARILLKGEEARVLPQEFAALPRLVAGRSGFFAIVAFPDRPPALVSITKQGNITELYSSFRQRLAPEDISLPEALAVPTEEGSVHAWFYAPKSASFAGPAGEKPPLLVMCHGGPTAMSPGDFRKSTQHWTNRGYAVADVNYGGSIGYGRKYRERLRGRWGVVDVQDCIAVVRHLAKEGRIDPKRVAIRGGSAGGYTTLAALAFTQGVISVGASYFGVSDIELLAKETHKLESRYLDQLIGPYPAEKALYLERSPLAHIEALNCPIIFFQGSDDKVVPPNQSEIMHQALLKKGIDSEYHLYQGEGHGFRKAESNQHSLRAEHAFYARSLGFGVGAEKE